MPKMASRNVYPFYDGLPRIFLIIAVLLFTVTTLTCGFNLEPQSALIFENPTARQSPSGRSSYFGFSVALQRNPFDNSSWLVVGAPRANSSFYASNQITEPGAIYKCALRTSQSPCTELAIDQMGNGETSNINFEFSYTDLKNHGWLGAALDSQPTFQRGRQATGVCAPRWINQHYYDQGFLNMNGACYWLNASLPNAPARKNVPLIQYTKQTIRIGGIALFYHAHGQAGMSIHFPDDPTEMIVGAPGIFNWQGSVIRFKDLEAPGPGTISRRRRRRQAQASTPFGSYLVPNPYHTSTIEDFDINGYAVTSGRFFDKDELLYVSGSPRGASTYGKVIIFSFPDRESASLEIFAERIGSQLGENFGASLVAADVDGDGLSDLVVGSPTFSGTNKPDMGRIQVFRSSKVAASTISESYSGSSILAARFGTTLASPGDMNHDGFADVAVGAPFENDGKGSVYIYMGSQTGLRQAYAQRITPEDFPAVPNLSGLGMGISRGIDIDGNQYPDLAIGSFLSGHAIVLRARAVASLIGELVPHPPSLRLEDTRLNLESCITYNGYRIPQNIDIRVNMTLDYNHPSPRATFSETGSFYREFVIMGSKGRRQCNPSQVDVKANKIDPRRPILVRMEYGILENSSQLVAQPKTDPAEESITTIPISIVTECEDDNDNICQIDMRIEAAFEMSGNDNRLIIGKDNRPVLEISVHNLGESVFLPNVTVTVLRPFALFLPISHNCDFANKDTRTTMVCQLANPIKKGQKDTVKVTIDAALVSDSMNELQVTINAAGEGVEILPQDNIVTEKLQLLASAELKLHGYSREEQILYQRLNEDKINTTSPILSFTHYYTLVKSGPTPLSRVELVVDLPVNFTDEPHFITVYAPETNFLGQPFLCTVEGTTLAVKSSENGNSENNVTALDKENTTQTAPTQNREDEVSLLPGFVATDTRSEGSLFSEVQKFSCPGNQISCARLRCFINSWPSEGSSAEISISMDLNLTVLAHHITARDGAFITSKATASILSLTAGLAFTGINEVTIRTNTRLLPSSLPSGRVAWWIILLAVLGGLLLLILLAFLLYRLGFFRRKKQEQLKAQKATVESNTNYGATTDES